MRIRKLILFLSIVLLAAGIGLMLSRNLLLNIATDHFLAKYEKRFQADFSVNKIFFNGIREIEMNGFFVVPPSGDTLLSMHSIRITPAWLNLLLGKISYEHLWADSIHLHLHTDSIDSNYSFLFRKKQGETPKESDTRVIPPFGQKLNTLYLRIFELVTGETEIRRFSLDYSSSETKRLYGIPVFHSDGQQFSCNVFNLSQPDTIKWFVNGSVQREKKGITFNMIRESTNGTMVSITSEEKSPAWLLDSLTLEAMVRDYSRDELNLSLNISFTDFLLRYWRVSPDLVGISSGKMDLLIHAGNGYVQVDTSSRISISSFKSAIGATYGVTNGEHYSLRLRTGDFPASNLFESLPKGMFSNLQGMKSKGDLNYSLDFLINLAQPDSLIFKSDLRKNNFSILEFGSDYLPRINDEFEYTAYDKFIPLRTFLVGSSNPDFTPLDQIGGFLKSAVLTSEDGGFYLHGGFNEEAFRQSIITNLKQGRFARGGSTISMQLVKNVYLSRDKTISRKLEEALIVWLLEKNHLVSKDRMLEVYLNIIEWGPNVYGIREAARFYFSKQPAELSLAESIFLASIIPHPKYFGYSFDRVTGHLKPFMNGFYRLVSDRMIRKNWILPADTTGLHPDLVRLTGPALSFILPQDSLPSDSIPAMVPDDEN